MIILRVHVTPQILHSPKNARFCYLTNRLRSLISSVRIVNCLSTNTCQLNWLYCSLEIVSDGLQPPATDTEPVLDCEWGCDYIALWKLHLAQHDHLWQLESTIFDASEMDITEPPGFWIMFHKLSWYIHFFEQWQWPLSQWLGQTTPVD